MAASTENCLEYTLSWCFWLLSCHWKCGTSGIKSGNETRFLKALQWHICHPLHPVFQLILAAFLSMQPTKQFVWPPALPAQRASEQLEQWDRGWDHCSSRMTNAVLKVTNTNPLWLAHMICLPTHYRKLGILGLFMSYDFCGTAIKLSYKIRTNLTLFTFVKFQYGYSVAKDYL